MLDPKVQVLVLPGVQCSCQLPVGTALLAFRFDLREGHCLNWRKPVASLGIGGVC